MSLDDTFNCILSSISPSSLNTNWKRGIIEERRKGYQRKYSCLHRESLPPSAESGQPVPSAPKSQDIWLNSVAASLLKTVMVMEDKRKENREKNRT